MDNEKKDGCGCNDECGCGHEHNHEHECNCGCEDEIPVVDLEDENGNVISCEVVDEFTYNESQFILVQNPEDDSVYLFKVVGEGEEAGLVVPEDEEFEAASAYYQELMEKEE